ncbi:MAG: hypothetical protein ABIR32_04370 [Ilumatobacteraceae bacterium]
MSDAIERSGHIAELAFIETAVQAAGYQSAQTGSDDLSVEPELIVALDPDEDSRARSLRISFIPVGDEVESTKFVQLWVTLPFEVAADRVDAVRLATAIVNEHVALGRFGVDQDGSVYFRYVLAARAHTMIDDDLIAEVVSFVDFHQEHFGDFVEGVCDGNIEIEVLEHVIRAAG